LLDFAIPKWKADSNVRIEDAYKWLYQATRGGEHAAPDRESAKQWLGTEWQSLGKPLSDEILWEPLCGDGSIGRVNLRVFRSKGGKMDEILDAFLAGAHEYKDADSRFQAAWYALGSRLKQKRRGALSYREWSRLDTAMKPKGYPAIHHSSSFEATHHPAYRIVTKSGYAKLLRTIR
jgi:hypothetical protein